MLREAPVAVDLVSPLPPVRSGVADYSADLLEELDRLCDLRIVRLPDQPIAAELLAGRASAPAELLGQGGRVPLYQMGNNLHHEAVLQLALANPGVLTLHDVWLHHLLVERTLARGEFRPYARALRDDHGWLGEAAAQPPRWGGYGSAALFALPAHRRLLLAQRGVLVHSSWARDVLAEEVGEVWAKERTEVVPMPMPLPGPVTPAAVNELRQRLQIPSDAFLLGSMGFQTPIKRTETVLRALARPGLEALHLLIGGEASQGLDFEARARELGVASRVHVTGFLEARDFPVAIAACDLCVNLRYPTAGETSASLLRILALGRGAIVSDFAQFADLPGAAVVKVPLGNGTLGGDTLEVEALATALRELRDHPERRRAMGEAARGWVETEHAPERSAEQIVSACRRWAEVDPPASGCGVAEPAAPSTLTWGDLPSAIEVSGAEAPWRAGERREVGITLTNRSRARFLAGERGIGGVVLEVQLLAGGKDLLSSEPWAPLPRDLAAGECHRFHILVRRPPGPARLRIHPHVLGASGFSTLGGALWEGEL